MISKEHNPAVFAELCQAEMGVYMIRIVICDDEPFFLNRLRTKIRTILDAHKVNAEIYTYETIEKIPDTVLAEGNIFFLDIDFANKRYTGLDVAKKIRKRRQDAIIIFATNYIEYAPEGYEVQAFRYLLKREIDRKLESCLLQATRKLRAEQETIRISTDGNEKNIPLSEILYIEAQSHLAMIYAQKKGGRTVRTYKFYASLAKLEADLGEKGFLRVHKSFLVNMRRIQKYQCTQAVLDNGQELPVSQKSYGEQKEKYLLWKGRQ